MGIEILILAALGVIAGVGEAVKPVKDSKIITESRECDEECCNGGND